LTGSHDALKETAIKEIKGEDCSDEFANFGFERCWYYSKYLVKQEKNDELQG
jgi:hypothetical protein